MRESGRASERGRKLSELIKDKTIQRLVAICGGAAIVSVVHLEEVTFKVKTELLPRSQSNAQKLPTQTELENKRRKMSATQNGPETNGASGPTFWIPNGQINLKPLKKWTQLIFSEEYLKAMNENFHVDHFVCRHCDSNLAGQRYVLKEEKPYCIQCYEDNFANHCEDCQKPIGIESRDLSYKERHWHDTCFVCAKCTQSLIDKPFGSKDEKVYCADCYETTFATRCDGCKNPFRAGSKKMEYHGRQWHDSCFCCCVCKNTIGSNSFIPKNDEIYCIKCYEDKYATRCTKCKQVIVTGGVTFRNEPWHRDCFNCCNCNKSLAGQRFTTRDTSLDESGKNLNKTNQPHNAYCIDCYGELFAKKCFACTQAITGLGGTRFVSFEERSWHNDCFLCNDCQTSLVGKGFITDGPESILCSECARAKLR